MRYNTNTTVAVKWGIFVLEIYFIFHAVLSFSLSTFSLIVCRWKDLQRPCREREREREQWHCARIIRAVFSYVGEGRIISVAVLLGTVPV